MFATLGYYICMPFAALVRLFYNMTGSYGLAIILFTVVIKLIMLPFQMKSKRSMMRMSRLSGKMEEIKKKYANNQAKMNEEIQKLYQEEGVNPMSGCVWTMIPLPILIALYSIIRQPISHFMMVKQDVVQSLVDAVTATGMDMSAIVQMKDGVAIVKDGITQLQPYGQIELAKVITSELPHLAEGIEGWINLNYNFIGLDLTVHPWNALKSFEPTWAVIGLVLIPIVAAGTQIVMSILSMKQQQNTAAGSTKSMMYMMSLMSLYIAFIMPAALGIYWIAQSFFSLIQEVIMNKFFNKKMEEEENARYEAYQAERQRKLEEGRKKQEAQRKQQAAAHKMSLKEKQKAAQDAKAAKAAKAGTGTNEAGRVGGRPYARGRAYQADRYDK